MTDLNTTISKAESLILKLAVENVDPEVLRQSSEQALIRNHIRLHQVYHMNFEDNDKTTSDGFNREQVVNAEILYLNELNNRGIEHNQEDALHQAAQELATDQEEEQQEADTEIKEDIELNLSVNDLDCVKSIVELSSSKLSGLKNINIKLDNDKIEKQATALMDTARKPGKQPATLQMHSRGRTLHTDLRFKTNSHLIGLTLLNQKAGRVSDVNTLAQARKIAKEWKVEGSFFFKSFLAPDGVRAEIKEPRPVSWLELEDTVFEAGETGATSEEQGVMVVIDKPNVERGVTEHDFAEFFFTNGKKLSGILNARKIMTGDDSFWRVFVSKQFLPSILKKANKDKMPPTGFSWIPQSLEEVTPKEFRYWGQSGEAAKKAKDALIDSRFFTQNNIKMVGGEFRKIEAVKNYYYVTKQGQATGGAHSHAVDFENETTEHGGRHNHIFVVNGEPLTSEMNGEHHHSLGSGAIPESGQHEHNITTNGSDAFTTNSGGGAHVHQLEGARTLSDGVHVHELILSSGEIIYSKKDVAKIDAIANNDKREFTLSWQWWKPQTANKRIGRQNWHLSIKNKDKLESWKLDNDPLAYNKNISGIFSVKKSCDLLEYDGEVDPGQRIGGEIMNRTKASRSMIEIQDRGLVEIIDSDSEKKVLRFNGERIKGVYTLEKQEGNFWGMNIGGKKLTYDNIEKNMSNVNRIFKLAGITSEELPGALTTIKEAIDFDLARDNPLVKEGEQKIILGVVLEPNVTDSQNDIYNAETIEAAAKEYRGQLGFMHERPENGAKVLGHYIANKAFMIDEQPVRKGTWLALIKVIDSELWESIKNKDIDGLSIGGSAIRESLEN